ncbi:type II CRISPR RNA-guided endonuclease Cas9 [Pediococcus acidilactici]|uniref:type II CRISPR RNA-guided endonuclease Cas9 n=1 Tax=Pediococcus acidilactici TaxID=1254 RepID=UPI000878A35F|nr:type II CRISPR RNA-guided endonuclease Cas9 [Pediococcus acidilactici]AOW75127.1 type II CRISPR RNA-guided endonuclease Cas9 [Pediococcus acidilactici]MCQ0050549.1 type II CRISPR RNA-guided endonuclease Cas9 [Pediococcus acidilactici]MCQ0052366.1 type II CRISPR RNA-guided endonuclease Cas9 [Pediococcus acidilactici]MCQ0054442.1 type II CRISPR RNA-guided endonuclease Cas9 [Pediococcus acidilactici]MCQ0061572.1 type II CRISPR RNA-guided endonuclease Cas9 [Pediococcus acidilactici]
MGDRKYNLGLDIGTSSIGFAAVDENNQPIRVKGKTAIGVRLFEEGKTAADRRGFRTTRRRLSRRRWRINLLNGIFDAHLAEVDPTFLARLKESNRSNLDPKKSFQGSLLFPERKDYQFYKEYPTIYHLRKALMEKDRKFDIREIYLAVHHIIKYRGNFLNGTPMRSFKVENIELDTLFDRLNQLYEEIIPDNELAFDLEQVADVKEVLSSTTIYKMDKKKQLVKMMLLPASNKALQSENKKIVTQFVNAILNYKFKLDVLLQVETDADWSLKLNDEGADDKLEEFTGDLDENRLEIIDLLQRLHNWFSLNEITKDGNSLSAAMVEKYKDHRHHLELLKKVIEDHPDAKKAKALKETYTAYVGKTDDKTQNQDDFYKAVEKNLDDSPDAKEIKRLIQLDQFMPKQRTGQNGAIPHQLHQQELDQIIEKQSKYYPFLAEPNPNVNRRKDAPYKLDELIAFKIPYYVGPLVTPEEQAQNGENVFAWMKRKAAGPITPWNFDKKVDRMESANRFIRRMTTKDTYLFGEDVLPAESMIYEKFVVLNELNNLKINGRHLSLKDKQDIYNDLFKQQKTVSIKALQNYYVTKKKAATAPTVGGLADPKKFLSSLSTYIDFKNMFGERVNDPQFQENLEQIVEWSTIFEDRGIFKAKLQALGWLSEKQIQQLVAKRYKGWGRLSKKLLTGLKNAEGYSILDEMWRSTENFMQIQSRPEFAALIQQANEKQFEGNDPNNVWENIENILGDAYTSPQNKKAIRQVVKVVQDIEKAVGNPPEKIAIEFTREAAANPQRTQSRLRTLEKLYESAEEVVDAGLTAELAEFKENKHVLSDKYYLYFTQLGRDVYTGDTISLDRLNDYDVDHILPQSFIKDDSLDNRVLTIRAVNNGKSDNVPAKMFGKKMGSFWRYLLDNGMISKRKYNNLITDPDNISKYAQKGFINRQLVETSQVIKLTANILNGIYDKDTEIIEVPAKMNSQMRKMFDLVKVREVNDYHHAFDAYLTIFIGNYLYKCYPKLRPYFVYDNFKKFGNKEDIGHKRFNFLGKIERDKKVVAPETGEILWSNVAPNETIKQIKKVYDYKFMLTSHETYTKHGALFNQTIYSAKASKTMIPIKNDRPTKLYGGYSGNEDAYMSIIRLSDKKKTYKVVGISMRDASKLKAYENNAHEEYLKKLKEVIEQQFLDSGKKTKADFEIVIPKVNYHQRMQDGTKQFRIGSSKYVHNTKQLVLSEKTLKAIRNNKQYNGDAEKDLINAFDEILTIVNDSFSIFDIRSFRKKLNESRDKFVSLPVEDTKEKSKVIKGKRETLKQILIALHANGTSQDIPQLGLKSFGKMVKTGGLTLSENTVLIHQSPSGLFERKIKLSDL